MVAMCVANPLLRILSMITVCVKFCFSLASIWILQLNLYLYIALWVTTIKDNLAVAYGFFPQEQCYSYIPSLSVLHH